LLIEQRNAIVNEYVESTRELKQRRTAFNQADLELEEAVDERDKLLSVKSREEILSEDSEYQRIQNDISQLEEEIAKSPASERKKLRLEKLGPLKEQLQQRIEDIRYGYIDPIQESFDELKDAFEVKGIRGEELRRKAIAFKQLEGEGRNIGARVDWYEEDTINGASPIDFADSVINEEVNAKQEVVDLAKEELEIAAQR
jgi:hypothetical protein